VALFIFLRCINKTMKFHLASNDDDAGAFDNVVVKCEWKEPGAGRTYFIQIKHRVPTKATIRRYDFRQIFGPLSLLKHFESYCIMEVKSGEDKYVKSYGSFNNYEFILYTNATVICGAVVKLTDGDQLNILSSQSYKTFSEKIDGDIFTYFEELSRYKELLQSGKLDSVTFHTF